MSPSPFPGPFSRAVPRGRWRVFLLTLLVVALVSPSRAALVNVALGGTASSSSQGYGTVAADGNDGNRNGDYNVGSVFHTLNESTQSWWQVQLPGPRYLDHIRIFNRTDAIQGSVGNVRIIAKNAGATVFSQVFLPANSADQNNSRAWGTAAVRGIIADSVRIERVSQTVPAGPDFMTFAEFEIWGTTAAPDPLIVPSTVTGSPAASGVVPGDANDGDINGNFYGPGSPVFSTLSPGVGQFWEMTFPAEFLVTSLSIFNRTDTATTTNVKVSLLSSSGGAVVWTQNVNLSVGAATPYNYGFLLAPNTLGRVVRIETLGNETLSLAEVQAFGTPGAIEPPIVENLTAINITAGGATLRANVTKTGFQNPNVKIYFGPVDGGTDPANWAQVRDLGAQSATASILVSGLTPTTAYYARAFAQNSAGSDWADSTISFTTDAPQATLLVTPAVGVNGYTALLDGRVLTVGFAVPTVTLYWGHTDGGTNAAAWESNLNLGTSSGVFGGLANNLQPNSTYYFRAAAVNSGGTTWTDPRTFTTNAQVPIVINEIHYKPEDRTRNTEFIELYNPSAASFNLGGWRLTEAVDYTFPAGKILPAGGYLVLAGNAAAFQAYYGFAPAGQWAGTLKNSGDLIELRDPNNLLVDQVDFAAGFPWPASADGGGPSIELIHPSLDNQQGGAWRSSTHSPLPQTPGAANSVLATFAPPVVRHVAHAPISPAAGQSVIVSAAIADPQGVTSATLQYQLVDPGGYIRKSDPAYATSWTTLPMNDTGANGDAVAGDGIYSVTLPAALQVHRRLVRYRISATNAFGSNITVPYADDEQPNFAYFVYNGVPAWSGALQPGAAAPRGTVRTFTATTLNRFEPWHLIANSTDVTNSQYNGGFDDQLFSATLVYDGTVYDHIQFKNRGVGSTYVSGKNKWGLRFNRTHDIRVKDNWGNYFEPWNSIPLEANASPWCAVHRGCAGVDEAASYRIYELGGVPALRTAYVHWRVIDDAAETGPTQYDGDFWGLYLALEPMEGNYLDERNLPDGNIYDIVGSQGDKKHQGATQSIDASDWNAFRDAANLGGQTEAWYRANMDLKALYTFFAMNRLAGNVDIRAGDNLRFYHRSSDNRWVIAPYDLDMMFVCAHHWGATIDGSLYAGVTDQFRAITRNPAIAREFRNRAREILDLFASDAAPGGGQAGQLFDEYSKIIQPGDADSWAAADAAMWNLNPRTAGDGTNTGYTSHRNNFFRSPFFDYRGASFARVTWTRNLPDADASGYGTFQGLMTWFTNYTTNTWPGGTWTRSNGDQRGYGYKYLEWESLYGGLGLNPVTPDLSFPATPAITYTGPATYPADALDFSSSNFVPSGSGGTTFAALQWRLGEISGPGIAGYVAGTPRKYELEEEWTSPEITIFTPTMRVPLAVAHPGRTYRARVRHKDANGTWSHWSAPAQFTVTQPDVSIYQQSLVISEVDYNPAPTTAAEIAAGFSASDFEWIELKNVGVAALDLTGIRFTKGVDFDFPQGYTIAPGGFALVVKNLAAFQRRFGHSRDTIIAGNFGTDNLNNGGEQLKLSFGAGTAIVDFTYGTASPWPAAADGFGYTLTLRSPASHPNHTLPESWRASSAIGGTPGADDSTTTFESWALAYPGASDLTLDTDRDGYTNLLEYALATHPLDPSARPVLNSALQEFSVASVPAKYLTLTFERRTDAADLVYTVEFCETINTPWLANAVLVSAIPTDHNTVIETWRSAIPSSTNHQFARLRVTRP